MNIQEKISKYLNEGRITTVSKLKGEKVKSIKKVGALDTKMTLMLKNGGKIEIGTGGGNNLEVVGDDEKTIKNDIIKNIKFKNEYHLIIDFKSGKRIEAGDDSGGEGIEV